jgi:anti-anti-sigma regulatory factor
VILCGLSHQVGEVDGLVVLRLRGDLGADTVAKARRVLRKLLRDHGRAVVDASGLTVSHPAALAVFPATLEEAGGWPAARLVILDPGWAVAAALRAVGVSQAIPLASSWEQAIALINRRPPWVSRVAELPADPAAGALAHSIVGNACTDWEITGLAPTAKLVAAELVANAVQHAHTPSVLALTLTPRALHIAVRDRARADDVTLRRMNAAPDTGHGLRLITGLATHWGVHRCPDGKRVWAALRTGARADPSPSVRESVQDFV